jgi:prepilin-type N-terminal cleavage/methylation domain-containing protein
MHVRNRRSAGFSLIELMIALAILTMMAVMIGKQFNTGKSKGQMLVTTMATIGEAMNAQKLHTGCHLRKMEYLYKKPTAAQNTVDDNFCAADISPTWSGPYVDRFTASDAGKSLTLPKLGSGVKVFIRDTSTDQAETGADGPLTDRVVYYLEAQEVPLDILKGALSACNSAGTKSAEAYNATFENGRCALRVQATRDLLDSANPASTAKGKIGMMFDETL